MQDLALIVSGEDPREELGPSAIRSHCSNSSISGSVTTRSRGTASDAADRIRADSIRASKVGSGRSSSIREADVRALHTRLGEQRDQRTANAAMQLLRRLFNWARITPNPAGNKAVNFCAERTRDRFLQPDELPKFFTSLDQEPNSTLNDFFYTSRSTGQHRKNVASMRRTELDLDRSTWTIPAEKTKNKEPQLVHLSAQSWSC